MNKELCIKHEELCTENDGFWILMQDICKECNLLGKQDMKTRRINPSGALLCWVNSTPTQPAQGGEQSIEYAIFHLK